RAASIAASLHARGAERIGVLVREPADVIAVLCAADSAGVETCLYPPHDERALLDLAGSLGHTALVVDAPLSVSEPRGILRDHPVSTAVGDPPTVTERPALLVLTTGTTGTPRATRHDLQRLLRAVRVDDTEAARWLLAYNLNQFAGLQVLLHVLTNGATLVVP